MTKKEIEKEIKFYEKYIDEWNSLQKDFRIIGRLIDVLEDRIEQKDIEGCEEIKKLLEKASSDFVEKLEQMSKR